MAQKYIKIFDDTILKQSINQGLEKQRTKSNLGNFTMGELAFTRDTCRLFVGNKSSQEDLQSSQFVSGGILTGNKFLGTIDSKRPEEWGGIQSGYPLNYGAATPAPSANGGVAQEQKSPLEDNKFRGDKETGGWSKTTNYNTKYDAYDGDYLYDKYGNALILFNKDLKSDTNNESTTNDDSISENLIDNRRYYPVIGNGYVVFRNLEPDGKTLRYSEKSDYHNLIEVCDIYDFFDKSIFDKDTTGKITLGSSGGSGTGGSGSGGIVQNLANRIKFHDIGKNDDEIIIEGKRLITIDTTNQIKFLRPSIKLELGGGLKFSNGKQEHEIDLLKFDSLNDDGTYTLSFPKITNDLSEVGNGGIGSSVDSEVLCGFPYDFTNSAENYSFSGSNTYLGGSLVSTDYIPNEVKKYFYLEEETTTQPKGLELFQSSYFNKGHTNAGLNYYKIPKDVISTPIKNYDITNIVANTETDYDLSYISCYGGKKILDSLPWKITEIKDGGTVITDSVVYNNFYVQANESDDDKEEFSQSVVKLINKDYQDDKPQNQTLDTWLNTVHAKYIQDYIFEATHYHHNENEYEVDEVEEVEDDTTTDESGDDTTTKYKIYYNETYETITITIDENGNSSIGESDVAKIKNLKVKNYYKPAPSLYDAKFYNNNGEIIPIDLYDSNSVTKEPTILLCQKENNNNDIKVKYYAYDAGTLYYKKGSQYISINDNTNQIIIDWDNLICEWTNKNDETEEIETGESDIYVYDGQQYNIIINTLGVVKTFSSTETVTQFEFINELAISNLQYLTPNKVYYIPNFAQSIILQVDGNNTETTITTNANPDDDNEDKKIFQGTFGIVQIPLYKDWTFGKSAHFKINNANATVKLLGYRA